MKAVWSIVVFALAAWVQASPPDLDAIRHVKQASGFVVISLYPSDAELVDLHGNRTGAFKDSERFHGFPILGKVGALSEAELLRVREALVETLRPVQEDRAPSLCFFPRHGICVENPGVHVDILLCFECGEARIICRKPEGTRSVIIGIGPEADEVLSALLDDRHVPRDRPKAKASTAPPKKHRKN